MSFHTLTPAQSGHRDHDGCVLLRTLAVSCVGASARQHLASQALATPNGMWTATAVTAPSSFEVFYNLSSNLNLTQPENYLRYLIVPVLLNSESHADTVRDWQACDNAHMLTSASRYSVSRRLAPILSRATLGGPQLTEFGCDRGRKWIFFSFGDSSWLEAVCAGWLARWLHCRQDPAAVCCKALDDVIRRLAGYLHDSRSLEVACQRWELFRVADSHDMCTAHNSAASVAHEAAEVSTKHRRCDHARRPGGCGRALASRNTCELSSQRGRDRRASTQTNTSEREDKSHSM